MARTTTFLGLNKRATDYLKNNAVLDKNEKPVITEVRESVEGMFGEEVHKLLSYHKEDGTIIKEEIQDMPWHSGPVIFLALQIDNEWIEESLWTQEEMNG